MRVKIFRLRSYKIVKIAHQKIRLQQELVLESEPYGKP